MRWAEMWQRCKLKVRTSLARRLGGMSLLLFIAACGGSGGETTTSTYEGAASSPYDSSASTSSEFHVWWVDGENGLFWQAAKSDKSEFVAALGQSLGNSTRSLFSVSRESDLFVEMNWQVQPEFSTIQEYSRKKIRQAFDSGDFTNRPREHYATLSGLILYHTLSHNGRYVAAIWAQDNYARIAKNVSLIVVDLWAPGGAKALHYSIPAGSEGIVGLPWISDHEFMYITSDLKVFRVDVSTTTYYDQGKAPAQFNGYKVVGINYSPDGQQVVGLMTRDGKTSEAFVAKSDFTNMRQLTNAGMVLNSATWMNAGIVQLSNLEEGALSVFSGGGYISDCRNYLIPTMASNWNQAQVEASKPTNLPCQFQASD